MVKNKNSLIIFISLLLFSQSVKAALFNPLSCGNAGTGIAVCSSTVGNALVLNNISGDGGNITTSLSGGNVIVTMNDTPFFSANIFGDLGSAEVAPPSGFSTLYFNTGVFYSINSSSVIQPFAQFYRTMAAMTSTQASTSTTMANVTSLVTSSLPAGTYHWQLRGAFQTAATTTGIGMRLAAGTATISTLFGEWRIEQAADGVSSTFIGNQLSASYTGNSTAALASATNYPIQGDGFVITTGTAGTLQFQFKSSVAASAATLQAGTSIMVEQVK